MNITENRLALRPTLERIVAYADGGVATERPLVIRTDSLVTSDILLDAAERLIKDSKKVVMGVFAPIDEGLNIVYYYGTPTIGEVEETIKALRGKKFIILVSRIFEPDEGMQKRIDFIDCFNEEAITVSTLFSELRNLPEDLYIFARELEGLYPVQVNSMSRTGVIYIDAIGDRLRCVRQMLEELEPVSDTDGAVIFDHDYYFVGIEEYDSECDYAIIEMVSREKCVDKLVNFFRH